MNVSLPDDFDKIIRYAFQRGIGIHYPAKSGTAQSPFENNGNIVGNCDEFLYLGGNEQSTLKYVSGFGQGNH